MLAIGPATAIRNSSRALVGSWCNSATPPKMNSVMPEIGIAKCRATSECESSWKTIEKNRPIVPATAIHQ